jgi:hypothetical protein
MLILPVSLFFIALFQRREICPHDHVPEGGLDGADSASAVNGEGSSKRRNGSFTGKVCKLLVIISTQMHALCYRRNK